MNILVIPMLCCGLGPCGAAIEQACGTATEHPPVVAADAPPARILRDAENRAPLPDSIKDRFVEVDSFDEPAVEVETLQTESGLTIELEVPESTALERLPGPSWAWPHGSCSMCLGNSMIQQYGQSKQYLDSIGYAQWQILWDNLHNDPAYEGVKGDGQGCYGGGYSSQRGGLFRRWRR